MVVYIYIYCIILFFKILKGFSTDEWAANTYLDPSEEDSDSNKIVVLTLPESQELKVSVLIWALEQNVEHSVDLDRTVDRKGDTHVGNRQHEYIQNIPKLGEVAQLTLLDL